METENIILRDVGQVVLDGGGIKPAVAVSITDAHFYVVSRHLPLEALLESQYGCVHRII